MKTINRTAVLLQPKRPFIDWLNKNERTGYIYHLDDRQNDAGLYLVDVTDNFPSIQDLIRRNFTWFFEKELNKYPYDRESWPDTSNFNVFKSWLDCSYHTIIEDLSEGPVQEVSL